MSGPRPPCLRCGSATEAEDLRCPVCSLAVPQSTEPTTRLRSQTLRCGSCGAAMEYRARVQAPQCAFCGGVVHPEEIPDPVEQAERYLPFAFDREAALGVYRQWLKRLGWFRPSNLGEAARLESLRPLWWVGWAVDAEARVTWTADSDVGAQRADWAPHAGDWQTRFDGLVIPASRGLTAAEGGRLILSYSMEHRPSAVDPASADAVVERFDLPRSAARTHIVETIRRLAEGRVQAGHIPGSRFRHFHAAIQLRGLRTRRLAFPAYVIAYRYGGRLFRTVLSGQDPACVMGDAPRSLVKIVLALGLGLLAAGLAVGLWLGRG